MAFALAFTLLFGNMSTAYAASNAATAAPAAGAAAEQEEALATAGSVTVGENEAPKENAEPASAPAGTPTAPPPEAASTVAPITEPSVAPVAEPTLAPAAEPAPAPTEIPAPAATPAGTERPTPTEAATATPAAESTPEPETAPEMPESPEASAPGEGSAAQAALEQALLQETPDAGLFASLPPVTMAETPLTTAYIIKNGESASTAIAGTNVDAFKLAGLAFRLADSYDDSYTVAGANSFEIATTLRLDDNWLEAKWLEAVAKDITLEQLYITAVDATDESEKKAAYKALNDELKGYQISGPQYVYNFGKDFTLPGEQLDAETPLTATLDGVKGMPIGGYTYRINAAGELTVTVTFEPYVLALNSVRADFSSKLKLSAELFEDSDTVDIGWNEDKLVLEIVGDLAKKDAPTHNDDIEASKTAAPTADQPYIDYEIRFAITNKNNVPTLDKLTMVDALPAGLLAERVSLAVNGGAPADLAEGEAAGSYTQTKNEDGSYTLGYTFPENGGVESAVFKVRAALTPEEYQKFMSASPATYQNHFTNTAELRGEQDSVYKRTEPTTTEMDATFFTKDGVQNPFNGNLFDWEINISTYFSQSVGAYLIDEIDPSQHTYTPGSLTIAVDGGTAKRVPLDDKNDNELLKTLTYEDFTSENIQDKKSALYQTLADLTVGGNAIYFTTADGKQMMILPFD
ncbi:MAG: hypothetical protein PHO10_11440, partial [Gemmiger sp.]|nr:hypothetical protein [Gemmiger sp.]